MQLKDTQNSYGWISIAMHWLVAVIILTLWFIGDSIAYFDTGAERNTQRQLHISIAICSYIFLWFRIGWRLRSGHPRLDGQGKIDHWVANTAHYLLLTGLALMLITGPLIIWSGGAAISVFDWFSIPSPIGINVDLYQFAHRLHGISANAILIVALIHMSGAFKHLMFNDDEIFLRMLTPLRKSRNKDTK